MTDTTTEPTAEPTSKPPSNLDILVGLLRARRGASMAEMTQATGWQPHSIRGAISSAIKRRGFAVMRFQADRVTRWRISPVKPAK